MKNRFNLSIIEKVVNTRYNDYRGFSAIDQHGDGRDFYLLLEKLDLDKYKYFIYGLEIYESEPVGKHDRLLVNLYLIDMDIYGNSYEKICHYPGTIELIKKRIAIPYEELGNYIKRISIGVVSPISAEITVSPIED